MKLLAILFAVVLFLTAGCSDQNETAEIKNETSCCSDENSETTACADAESCGENNDLAYVANLQSKPKVTFVELGSVNCIPCKQMQPVLKAIEEKYGDQVKVVFHDVWKPEEKHYAQDYGIKLIPTQVFLDENGKEFHRHEGFYPETEIDKILQGKGLKVKGKSDEGRVKETSEL